MTVVEIALRARAGGGAPVERVVCHPTLPLVACLDSARPAVHVWDWGTGSLREVGTVGAEAAPYGDALDWDRTSRTPAVAWHPDQPLLLVAGEGGVVRWTPAGTSTPAGVPPGTSYRDLAFSPDGRVLLASPSSDGAWDHSDVVDLATGAVEVGPRWDTGITAHPAGGLVVTLCSDQGATLGLFARVDPGLRVLDRALVLDVDGYEAPVFSADGRRLAIRGNAYENTLEVFDFPSLELVLSTTLGSPSPGYPYPPEWLDEMHSWSRHNIAFGAPPGSLWVGTPAGELVELDLDGERAVEHEVLDSPVTALAAAAAGGLVVAGGNGELVLLSVTADPATARVVDHEASRAAVATFLATASEVPGHDDLEERLVLTDGTRAWDAEELAGVTEAEATDPTWLRLRAAVNTARDRNA
ncbi:WD40 repeat domain-containing protein [Saccharothrix syringae]|uniref:WD40 repeat domain-containing protein n=1 Tax=Saccharothrix syringae TaxID=103733 RepID=UPI001B8047F2|nr:WD40 repeat domain-containing protein [Saccharothrix syringae]